MEFGGHQVYTTPKANLVAIHKEFNSVVEASQIAKLKAMFQAASVQLNQLDPALPVQSHSGTTHSRDRRRTTRPYRGDRDLRDHLTRNQDVRQHINERVWARREA